MVAYSFQKQFVEPIRSGRKRQTIRAIGKRRHAHPGDQLQLYSGMRTKHCERIIPDTPCLAFQRLRINFGLRTVIVGPDHIGPFFHTRDELDEFARSDGFENWEGLEAFWRKHHKGVDFFDGFMVSW